MTDPHSEADDHLAPPGFAQRQFRLLLIYAGFSYPFAAIPFLYFWYEGHGLDLEAYGRLLAVYYATMFVAEIPTGILADRWGRRVGMVIGPSLLAAAFGTLWMARTEPGFALGQMFFGLGHAFLSGPPAALLYDSLADRRREHEFVRRESLVHAVRLHGTGGAFLLGGILASLWGIGATLIASAALCTVAAGAALLLQEPTRHRVSTGSVVRAAWAGLRDRHILWITGYFTVLFFLIRYGFHNYQPYLKTWDTERVSLGAWWFLAIGALYFVLNFGAAEATRATPWFLRRLGLRGMLWLLPLLMAVGVGGMALPLGLFGVVVFAAQQLPFGLHWPVVQGLINRRIRGSGRTTVLSILSLSGRLTFAVAAIPLFALQDQWGAPTIAIGAAAAAAAAVALLLISPNMAADPDDAAPNGTP